MLSLAVIGASVYHQILHQRNQQILFFFLDLFITQTVTLQIQIDLWTTINTKYLFYVVFLMDFVASFFRQLLYCVFYSCLFAFVATNWRKMKYQVFVSVLFPFRYLLEAFWNYCVCIDKELDNVLVSVFLIFIFLLFCVNMFTQRSRYYVFNTRSEPHIVRFFLVRLPSLSHRI